MEETQQSLRLLYIVISLIPVLMLVLSAGIAWGVTSATVRTIKTTLIAATNEVTDVAKDFASWKQDRLHAVVTSSDCHNSRRECGSDQITKINSMERKLDDYMEKADLRWHDLDLSIKVLTAHAQAKLDA